MKYGKSALAFFIAFIIQATILNMFSIFGATPNLFLCMLVIFVFLYDDRDYFIVLGVVFGLFMDICYMPYVGVSALGYFILGVALIVTREMLNKENIATIVLLTVAATPAFNLFTWAVYAILGSSTGILYVLRLQPLYIFCNLIVVVILYFVIIRRVIKHRKDRYYK